MPLKMSYWGSRIKCFQENTSSNLGETRIKILCRPKGWVKKDTDETRTSHVGTEITLVKLRPTVVVDLGT